MLLHHSVDLKLVPCSCIIQDITNNTVWPAFHTSTDMVLALFVESLTDREKCRTGLCHLLPITESALLGRMLLLRHDGALPLTLPVLVLTKQAGSCAGWHNPRQPLACWCSGGSHCPIRCFLKRSSQASFPERKWGNLSPEFAGSGFGFKNSQRANADQPERVNSLCRDELGEGALGRFRYQAFPFQWPLAPLFTVVTKANAFSFRLNLGWTGICCLHSWPGRWWPVVWPHWVHSSLCSQGTPLQPTGKTPKIPSLHLDPIPKPNIRSKQSLICIYPGFDLRVGGR